ncbi:MAG: SPOR domain-containing protein [Bacteroidales bacterium]|nr:SPOR domain-containing protein [Bacteroidales bacterium]
MRQNSKIWILLALLSFLAPRLMAQNLEEGTGEIEHAGEEVQVDSALFGRDIFSALPEQVVIRQDPSVRDALGRQVRANADKNYSGFRIRLYFASSRTAREESAAVIRRFSAMYPNIQAYRTYASPNFKVTVGNFRTRLEAEALLRELKGDFPDAFIVRERFKYPSIGRADARPAATE